MKSQDCDINAPAAILVIDDEKSVCCGCELALSEYHHEIRACFTGKSGLKELNEGRYDLVLLDMKLPDMDGMDVLKIIRKEKPQVSVVIMTGYSSVENAVQAMKLGTYDYLAKPFAEDELVVCVHKAIRQKRLVEENLALRQRLYAKFDFSNIVGENPSLLGIFEEIRKLAPTSCTVLLEGESGTGKELFAKAIHAHSQRASRQFIVIDCSTFSPSLLESELFGHVKGAFTGAIQDKTGIFELADGGTLFLDEVANLSLDVQGKLLRIMETCEYRPVGSGHSRKADMRIIAATNQNLKKMVDDRSFRTDLFYRLNVLPIRIPSLRERRDDIPKLAYHFLRMFCREMGRHIEGFSDEALATLIHYDWPGNVRELKNVVERLVIMSDQRILDYRHLGQIFSADPGNRQDSMPGNLDELKKIKKRILEQHFDKVEKAFLHNALARAQGSITRAAEAVGMQRSNFSNLLKKHQIMEKPRS